MRSLDTVDEKFFDKMVDINYKGIFFSVQRALPFFNATASVVLISSAAGHIGWPGHSVYSSTKAAVSYLARSFAAELIPRGIRVNAISPGFVDTPMFDAFKSESPATMQALANLVPSKRFATSEEIAEVALVLSSSHFSYIVGADLVVDGGITAVFNINENIK